MIRICRATDGLIVAELVRFETVRAVHETPKAVLCEFLDGWSVWVPKSQIGPSSEVRTVGDFGTLEVRSWWADKSGATLHLIQPEDTEPSPAPPAPPPIDLREARTIYRQLVAKYHPDRNVDGEETMQDINQLWQAIISAIRKTS